MIFHNWTCLWSKIAQPGSKMFGQNQNNFGPTKGWDFINILATFFIGERCLKEISKYLISSAIWSLSPELPSDERPEVKQSLNSVLHMWQIEYYLVYKAKLSQ